MQESVEEDLIRQGGLESARKEVEQYDAEGPTALPSKNNSPIFKKEDSAT